MSLVIVIMVNNLIDRDDSDHIKGYLLYYRSYCVYRLMFNSNYYVCLFLLYDIMRLVIVIMVNMIPVVTLRVPDIL